MVGGLCGVFRGQEDEGEGEGDDHVEGQSRRHRRIYEFPLKRGNEREIVRYARPAAEEADVKCSAL
jgi:hypothetical protein